MARSFLFGEPTLVYASALRQRETSQVDDAFDVIIVIRVRLRRFVPASLRTLPAIICCFMELRDHL